MGELRGKADKYFENNCKLHKYIKEQEKTFQKEILMLNIRNKCEDIKKLFKRQEQAFEN